MVEKIKFDLVSPDKILLSKEVEMVTIPGGEGDYGVMQGHQPMITTLRPGLIEIDIENSESIKFYVDGGFAEVSNFECSVLADDAVSISEVQKSDIKNRIKLAEDNAENLKIDTDVAMNEIRIEVLNKILTEL